MSRENKRKTGSIAVPFLVTIFIGLLVIGGAMFYVYKHYFDKEDVLDVPPPRTNVTTATVEDNHTILLILDERSNTSLPEKVTSTTYVVMRSIPYRKQLLFIGVPSNTITLMDGQQQRLRDVFERKGAAAAKDFVSTVLGVDVDRYMVFDSSSLRRVCEIFGNVKAFPVDAQFSTFKGDGSPQNLNAQQVETYITYSLFKRQEVDRALKTANILRYMVNGAACDRIADNFDRYFDEMINTVASDITSMDYEKRGGAIKYMLKNASSFAMFDVVTGEVSGSDFIPNSNYVQYLPDEYFEEYAGGSKK